MAKSSSNDHYAKVGLLMELARYRLDEVFDALGIRARLSGSRFIGRCPIHGGRRYGNFLFWPTGREDRAFWVCMSHHCERHFWGNVIGFVRGSMSHDLYGWEQPGDKEATHREATNELCRILGLEFDDLKPDMEAVERQRFDSAVFTLHGSHGQTKPSGPSRHTIREFLEIPSGYYVGRGYTSEVLDTYDVGLCQHPASDLYGRVVIPFYDEDGKTFVGAIGRSVHEECPRCGWCHSGTIACFTDGCRTIDYCKVRVSNRFNDKNHLYNYWYAKEDILKRRCVVVVEGAADVWRLVEAGIANCVAINGSSLSEPQQIALECSGATEILCLTDNDQAGENAYKQIKERCWFATTRRIHPVGVKDVGNLTVDDPLFDHIKDHMESKCKTK